MKRLSSMLGLPYTPDKSMAVYAVNKGIGERAMWEWAIERKPRFVANSGISRNICVII